MPRKTTSQQEAITAFTKVLLGVKREDALMIASAIWYGSGLLDAKKEAGGVYTNTNIDGVSYQFVALDDDTMGKILALLDSFDKIL